MLLIARLRRDGTGAGGAPTLGRYYAFLAAAWLFTAAWLVGVYWTATASVGLWRWVAWVLLSITTPDLPSLFWTYSRYAELWKRQHQPPGRQWFMDVRTGPKR
jgi:hypothetical protein